MPVKRALWPTLLLILSLAVLAPPAGAHGDHEDADGHDAAALTGDELQPGTDHTDTPQELAGVNLAAQVGQARLQLAEAPVLAAGAPTAWCGSETGTDTIVGAVDPAAPQ